MRQRTKEREKCLKRIDLLDQGKEPRKFSKEDRRILGKYFTDFGVIFLIGASVLLPYFWIIHNKH